MLGNRIIGALTFRKGVYAEVEHDTTFTTTAWLIVVVVAFLNELGSNASANLNEWLVGALAGTIAAVIGFAAAAFLVSWIGEKFFYAEVTFQEMVRAAGLAYVWKVIGVLGVLSVLSPGMTFLTGPVVILGEILWLIALLIAVKEALDKEWPITIVIVFLGWLGWIVVRLVLATILFWTGFATKWFGAFFEMIFG